jgi:hypothetical protein
VKLHVDLLVDEGLAVIVVVHTDNRHLDEVGGFRSLTKKLEYLSSLKARR